MKTACCDSEIQVEVIDNEGHRAQAYLVLSSVGRDRISFSADDDPEGSLTEVELHVSSSPFCPNCGKKLEVGE